jgi:hypothetical protein
VGCGLEKKINNKDEIQSSIWDLKADKKVTETN